MYKCTMVSPKFIVSNQKEETICIQRVKVSCSRTLSLCHFVYTLLCYHTLGAQTEDFVETAGMCRLAFSLINLFILLDFLKHIGKE